MSEEMFGPDPGESAGWGGDGTEPSEPGGESMVGIQNLGHGTFIRVNEDIIKGLLRTPAAIAALNHRAKAVLDTANANHVTGGAVYEMKYVDNGGRRPVIFVKPANFKAVIDEQYHSTLLAAAATVGSDPLIQTGETWGSEMAAAE